MSDEESKEVIQIADFQGKINEYKKEFSINLEWKDVQYDMANNLDKEFIIAGVAEIDDYYNYGFDDSIESRYYCVNITPPSGSYTNRWYLYLHRDSSKDLFNKLKEGKVEIITTCTIPKYRFKKG